MRREDVLTLPYRAAGLAAGLRSMAALLARAVQRGDVGALSAIAAAYTGEKLRVKGAEKLGAPDQILGLLEDGVVLFGGTYLLRNSK